MVTYVSDGFWEYTRLIDNGSPTTTIFVETDGSGPEDGTPIFNAPADFFPDLQTTGDGTPGYTVGEDLTGQQNLFYGAIDAQIGGDTVKLIMITGSDEVPAASGNFVSDDDTFLVLLPDGVLPGDVLLPRTLNETFDVDTGTFFCVLEGTLIETPHGPLPVEALTPEHQVLTADGRAEPVCFVGRQTMDRRLPAASGRSLVQIRAGALGDGLPRRDLTLTGDHALLLDGLLVNAKALVNGTSVRFLPSADAPGPVRVYHVETAAHEAILAEGVACESFIDYAARRSLDNYGAYLERFGAERLIPEMNRPRITRAAQLPAAIRDRLASPAETPDAEVA